MRNYILGSKAHVKVTALRQWPKKLGEYNLSLKLLDLISPKSGQICTWARRHWGSKHQRS